MVYSVFEFTGVNLEKPLGKKRLKNKKGAP
jgi:hypothetical protein